MDLLELDSRYSQEHVIHKNVLSQKIVVCDVINSPTQIIKYDMTSLGVTVLFHKITYLYLKIERGLIKGMQNNQYTK